MKVRCSFFKAMSKVPHFKVDTYQIVGCVYFDAEIRETGPTIILYKARYNFMTKKVKRNYCGVIAFDAANLENLGDVMKSLERKYPNIANAQPCFTKPDHQNQDGSRLCFKIAILGYSIIITWYHAGTET